MHVLLVRHAEAVDVQTAASDHDRWLTRQGRATMAGVGAALAGLGLRYDAIYTSPLVRAVQTAELLARTATEFGGEVRALWALSTEKGTTAQALAPLAHAPDDALIAFVTHMPKVGALASHLGQLRFAPEFRTGSACLLRVDGGGGRVEWMLDPRTLERRSL